MSPNTKLQLILDEYGESHQKPANQKIHKICVPLIMFSLLGLLSELPGPVNWTWILVAFGLIYYFRFRNLSVYLILLVQLLPVLFLIHLAKDSWDWRPWLSIFVIAWIGQFIGHKIEGKKPSFFQDIFFLLIGPIWILRKFVKP